MPGIFGFISNESNKKNNFNVLVNRSERRGKNSGGLFYSSEDKYFLTRGNKRLTHLLDKKDFYQSNVIVGLTGLDVEESICKEPTVTEKVCIFHDGIIINDKELLGFSFDPNQPDATGKILAKISSEWLQKSNDLVGLADRILSLCKGMLASTIIIPSMGKILLFSNYGNLYIGNHGTGIYFASERYTLQEIKCADIQKVDNGLVFDIPISQEKIIVNEKFIFKDKKIFNIVNNESRILKYDRPALKRCNRCVLPETMPFIKFDLNGVCNYCLNYRIRNSPKTKEEIFKIVDPYRKINGKDCIVPFSGGRDSCYALHLIVNELKMKPITYTYDWGMVTDVGRRNISVMCGHLGVENIVVADDFDIKRKNIAMNLKAWLKAPNLGMLSILTAGDKHFFRHVDKVKNQTNIDLNLWGINPLEVTHFKTGFLGIPPDFVSNKVYTHGALKQLRYQSKRLKEMCKSLGYFNSSLWDTLSGEYYRSFTRKSDYFHIFDYWQWDENVIDDTLGGYGWERAADTTTTWRIGDGVAGFYNYVYYTVAGFTEHDTFRSNQVREGAITRKQALDLIEVENEPRYHNIEWYLRSLGFSFRDTIEIVNSIPKIYQAL
ncbi:glucosamine 6-phosphate synthetase [Alcaligenaceae bacterium]|nr:glucosamine 6-phosphate synthetase [Alcaligenaceae bacterium]